MMKLAAVLPYWFDRPAGEAIDIACNADRLSVESARANR
jgi:hypothetical protein